MGTRSVEGSAAMTLEQKARQLRTIFEQVAENGTEIFVYNATCIEMLRISQEAIGMRGDGPIPQIVIQWAGDRDELLRGGVGRLVEGVGKA